MRKAASLVMVFFCLLFPPTAFSEIPQAVEPEKGMVLSLREAVKLGVNPLDRTGPAIARWRVKEEQGRLWPELSLEGWYSLESSESVSQEDQGLLESGADIQRQRAEMMIRYNLLQFLESRPRIQAALADERASLLRLSHEEIERISQVSEAYLTLHSKQEALKALEVLRSDQFVFLRQQAARFAAEMIHMVKLVQAQSQLISLDREILAVRGEAAAAELDLRKLTGLEPKQPIALSFDPQEVDLSFLKAEGLSGLLSRVREGNRRLLTADAAVEGARWRAAAARSLRYPTLSLRSSFGLRRDEISDGTDFRSNDFRFTVFLTLSLPLFDGGVRRARIAQANLQADSQLWQAARTAEEVKSMIEAEYWSFVEKEQDRALLEQQVQLTEDGLKQVRVRVEEGVAPSEELLAAVSNLIRLKREQARIRSEAWIKGIRLSLAVGRNPFISSPHAPPPRREAKPSLSPLSFPPVTRVARKASSPEAPPSSALTPTAQREARAVHPGRIATSILPQQASGFVLDPEFRRNRP